jgi:four helix bundle protein
MDPDLQFRSSMEKPFDIRERTFIFACDVVGFSRVLANRGFVMRRLAGQLVDAGCSIGANAAEAPGAQSKPDFITKNCIALKEAREARFWLRVIIATEPQVAPTAKPLLDEVNQLVAIIYTIARNARAKKQGTRCR